MLLRLRLWWPLVAVIVLVAASLTVLAGPAAAADPFTVWVSPTGDDGNSGLDRADPVTTLGRAQQVVCPAQPCVGLGRPVEIRIEPGVYPSLTQVTWTYFDDVYPTRFWPADYQDGWVWSQVAAAGGRPQFDGQGSGGHYGLTLTPDRVSSTGTTNWDVRYLHFVRFPRGGVEIVGGTMQRANGNYVYGNAFEQLGNLLWPVEEMGYAGLFLGQSDSNTVVNNHFVDIINDGAGLGHEHGTYLINARYNTIAGNRFEDVGGDPVRVRHQSAGNLVESNTFTRTGNGGYIGEWYCVPNNPNCSPVEYRSFSNVFRSNVLNGPYVPGPLFRIDFCYDLPLLGYDCTDDRVSVQQ